MKTHKGINITPFTERYDTLRAEMLRDLQALRDQGLTFREIGELVGMTRSGVNNFIKGHSLSQRKKPETLSDS